MSVKIIRNIGRPTNVEYNIQSWAEEIANWFINWQMENDKIATAESINSYEIIVNHNEVILSAVGYIKYVLEGRGPGKFPPPEVIKKWIEAKPINFNPDEITLNSLAYLIGRKISREGTNPPKLQDQNISLIINQIGIKYLERISEETAENVSKVMVEALTKSGVFTEK